MSGYLDVIREVRATGSAIPIIVLSSRDDEGSDTNVQYLRIYVRALRQKIEPDPEQPIHILTETGVGYRLRSAD